MTATRTFIARMKLRRLRVQRDALREQHAAILAEAEQAATVGERVRVLYERLTELRLASEPVHPELPDLGVVVQGLALGFEAAGLEAWEERLRAELRRGAVRSEAAFAYGRLLEERASADEGPDHQAFLRTSLAAQEAPRPAALNFDEVPWTAQLAKLRATAPGMPETAPPLELDATLYAIAENPERDPALREEASSFRAEPGEDGAAAVGLADAMDMLLEDAAAWRWPSDGVEARPVQTHDRVRIHPAPSLVDLLLLETVAEWFGEALPQLRSGHATRRKRLARLLELNAPDVIVQNERRMLEGTLGPLDDPAVVDPEVSPDSIVIARESAVTELSDLGRGLHAGYGYGTQTPAMVRWVNAEVALARAFGQPVFVVRSDIEDCFNNIDHDVVRRYLAQMGLDEPWLAFVDGFLRVPYRVGHEVHTATHGVPVGLGLSRILVEQLLALAELRVREACDVRIARAVDDVVFIAHDPAEVQRAWSLWQGGVAALGLSVQPAKSGTTAIGAPCPKGLPSGPARWNVLALSPEGWRVDDAAFEALLDRARADLAHATCTLAGIERYRDHAKFLVEALVVDTALGWHETSDHLEHAATAVRRFGSEIAAGGIEAWVRARLSSVADLDREPCRGWLVWPITAGGLGLYDPTIDLAVARPTRPEQPAATGELHTAERTSEPWGRWYAALLNPGEPSAPREDAIGKARVQDFIDRGGELRGTKQTELSAYWRWVLSTYGEEILETFGTFRFLPRKLVPLDLISGVVGTALG